LYRPIPKDTIHCHEFEIQLAELSPNTKPVKKSDPLNYRIVVGVIFQQSNIGIVMTRSKDDMTASGIPDKLLKRTWFDMS
jgi:hypothetical protein